MPWSDDVQRQPLGDLQEVFTVRDEPMLLILGRPSCDDCVEWYAALATWTPPHPLKVCTLDLSTELGEVFKEHHAWTAHIEMIPFNVLYVDGEPVDQWAGGSVERLVKALQQPGD